MAHSDAEVAESEESCLFIIGEVVGHFVFCRDVVEGGFSIGFSTVGGFCGHGVSIRLG